MDIILYRVQINKIVIHGSRRPVNLGNKSALQFSRKLLCKFSQNVQILLAFHIYTALQIISRENLTSNTINSLKVETFLRQTLFIITKPIVRKKTKFSPEGVHLR